MAVPYELNGKTIMLSVDDILDLDDQAIQELIARDLGVEINDPFADGFNDFETKDYRIEPLDKEVVDKIKKEFDESK